MPRPTKAKEILRVLPKRRTKTASCSSVKWATSPSIAGIHAPHMIRKTSTWWPAIGKRCNSSAVWKLSPIVKVLRRYGRWRHASKRSPMVHWTQTKWISEYMLAKWRICCMVVNAAMVLLRIAGPVDKDMDWGQDPTKNLEITIYSTRIFYKQF